MSTYIQGVTDYIPEIQPFKPDLNFLGNVMQTRQSRYDSSKKQISDLYGSLLNGPMSRPENIKNRDEFFKVIDNEIKKISGLDLSLQQNVDQAESIFKSFTEDKNMMKDMSWTKNFMNKVDKHEALKNCTDPKKCGDTRAWETGLNELYYKRDEFKNATAEEALNFANVEYNGYYDWKPLALKAVKDLNYHAEQDSLTGGWIVRDKDGYLIQGGLESVFNEVYGSDPRVESNYESMAYVDRKNAAKAGVMEYGSEEEAEKHHIMTNITEGVKGLNEDLKTINNGYDQLNSKIAKLDIIKKTGNLTPPQQEAYDLAVQQKASLQKSKEYYESAINDIQNNIDKNDINSLRQRSDRSSANIYKSRDMKGLAKAIAGPGSRTYTANPYGEIRARLGADKELANYKAIIDLNKLNFEHGLNVKLAELKGEIKGGGIPTMNDITTIEAYNPGVVDLDLKNHPDAGFERSATLMHKSMHEAQANSASFLMNAITAAKTAYKTNPEKNAGALQFLKQFGDDYDNIRDASDLNKRLSSKNMGVISTFNSFIQNASNKKNPTGDYDWAYPLVQRSGEQIYSVKSANDAFHSLMAFNVKNNKKIAETVKAKYGADNPVAKYGNLIVTSSGFFERNAKTFAKKYIDANATDGKIVNENQALEAYDALKTQFFDEYNRTPNVSIDQGLGLDKTYGGTGNLQASAIDLKTIDSKNYGKDKTTTNTIDVMSKALSSSGVVVSLGDGSSINYKEGANAKLQSVVLDLINKARTADPKSDSRPVFNAVIAPIAANKENVSVITLSALPQEITKEYTAKGGILEGKDLSKISIFYDNEEVKTPFKAGYEMSPTEINLKTQGHTRIDAFQDDVGVVDLIYDPSSNKVNGSLKFKYYERGVLKEGEMPYNFGLESTKYNEANIIETLKTLQVLNLQAEAAIAKAGKN